MLMTKQEDGKRNWISIMGTISGIFLGAILIIATIGKIADPVLFVEQIRKEGLEIIFSANTVAVIALAWETLAGLALFVGIRNYWVMIPTTGLSVFFLFLTGRTFYQVLIGERQDSYECGCFGIFLQRTATEAFWQDLFILVPPIVFMLLDSRGLKKPLPKWRTIFSVLGTVVLVVYTLGWAGLPETVSYRDSIPEGVREKALQPSNQFSLFIDDQEISDAEIFGSDFTLIFVIISSELDSGPLVVDIQRTSIAQILSESVIRNDDGSIIINDSKPSENLGNFEIGTQGMSFQYQGRLIEMRSRL